MWIASNPFYVFIFAQIPTASSILMFSLLLLVSLGAFQCLGGGFGFVRIISNRRNGWKPKYFICKKNLLQATTTRYNNDRIWDYWGSKFWIWIWFWVQGDNCPIVRCWTRLSPMRPCFDHFSAISTNRRGTNSSVFQFPVTKALQKIIFRSMVRNIQAQMMNMKNILTSFWRRAIVKVN